jgi:hypothetical protein
MADPAPSSASDANRALVALLLGAGLLLAAAFGHFACEEEIAGLERQLALVGRYNPAGEASPGRALQTTYESYDRLALGVGVVGALVLVMPIGVLLSRLRRGGGAAGDTGSGATQWRRLCRAVCALCGELGPAGRGEAAAHRLARAEGFRRLPGAGWHCAHCRSTAGSEVVPAGAREGREVTPG